MDERRVVEVVGRHDRPLRQDGAPGHAHLNAVVRVVGPAAPHLALAVGCVDAEQRRSTAVEDVHAAAVAAGEARGLAHHEAHHRRHVALGEDPRAQLAQRALQIGLALGDQARPVELLDQACVRDLEGGVVGERADQGHVPRAERVGPPVVHAECAEHLVTGDERRHDQGPQARLAGERVSVLGVRKPIVGEVVARHLDSPVGDRLAEHPLPHPEADLAHPVVLGQAHRAQLGRES